MITKVTDQHGREIVLHTEKNGYTTAMHNNEMVCSGTSAQVSNLLTKTAPIDAVCFD
jgi:hypothetical protein